MEGRTKGGRMRGWWDGGKTKGGRDGGAEGATGNSQVHTWLNCLHVCMSEIAKETYSGPAM